MALIETHTECIGECRIGAVAPLSDTHCVSEGSGMAPVVQDRLSVAWRGLKASVMALAQAAGTSVSVGARTASTQALHVLVASSKRALLSPHTPSGHGRTPDVTQTARRYRGLC
jgi:hypothetical protein